MGRPAARERKALGMAKNGERETQRCIPTRDFETLFAKARRSAASFTNPGATFRGQEKLCERTVAMEPRCALLSDPIKKFHLKFQRVCTTAFGQNAPGSDSRGAHQLRTGNQSPVNERKAKELFALPGCCLKAAINPLGAHRRKRQGLYDGICNFAGNGT